MMPVFSHSLVFKAAAIPSNTPITEEALLGDSGEDGSSEETPVARLGLQASQAAIDHSTLTKAGRGMELRLPVVCVVQQACKIVSACR